MDFFIDKALISKKTKIEHQLKINFENETIYSDGQILVKLINEDGSTKSWEEIENELSINYPEIDTNAVLDSLINQNNLTNFFN